MKKLKPFVWTKRLKRGFTFKALSPSISIFILFAYVNFIVGCSYYNVNTLDPLSNESIAEQVQKRGKYIILHQDGKVWHIKDVKVNEANQELTGMLEELPINHQYYLTAKDPNKANRYKQKGKSADSPIHEIHIYSSTSSIILGSPFSVPFSTITKVEVYDTHVGATVFSALGVIAAATGLVALIIVATKSSCPFVYTNNGDSYNFVGEMYGGAIYASLERDDYMPLPNLTPINNEYQLRISNELLERQYTNVANLVVVEHANNANVILDKAGNIQTITSPESPLIAITNIESDAAELILKKDSSSYLFDNETSDGKDLSSLTLSFKKPENSKTGKLILNAKNSFWLDYAYGKFNEQFGTYFNTFVEKQRKVPAQKHNQWSLDQNIPLSVYIETEKGWRFVDYFNSIGPLASRDIVMPIDLSQVKGENVKIKIECGFMFWEVDYAAMDFSENVPVEVNHVKVSSAIDEKGKDVAKLIEKSDKQYLIQPEIGNVVTLEYPAITPKANQKQTVFLYSRGYYEYIRDYKNWPDVVKLQSFKEKGSFTNFSKTQFNEFISTKDIFAASLTQPNGN